MDPTKQRLAISKFFGPPLISGLALVGGILLTGCASLHIRESDSVPMAVTKGLVRFPVGVISFGFSEIWHATEREMEAWVGKDRADLIMKYGMPSDETSDGEGGRILIYKSVGSVTTGGYSNSTFIGNSLHTSYNPPQTTYYDKIRSFRLNRRDEVVSYSWTGM